MINQHDPLVQSNPFSYEIWHQSIGAYDYDLAMHAAKHYYATTLQDDGTVPKLQPRMLKKTILTLKDQYEARHRAQQALPTGTKENDELDDAERAKNIQRLRDALKGTGDTQN